MDQIRKVADAGADLVRVAVPRDKDIEALKTIVVESPIPIIADIHFNHTLALKGSCPTPAIRNLIREDKVHQVYRRCRWARPSSGCRRSTRPWRRCWPRRLISQDEAFGRLSDPEELRNILANGGRRASLSGRQRPAGR